MQMIGAKKIQELDFARVISMLAVIMIHVSSTYVRSPSSFLIGGMNLAFILNQLSRFAVPLFVLISGVSLGLSRSDLPWKDFYKRRLLKIGLPYVFWSLIYILFNHRNDLTDFLSGGKNSVLLLLKSILQGSAASHLYFIIVIMQLYALYPLLKKMVEDAPWEGVLFSFILTYTVQKAFYFLKFDLDLIPGCIRPYLWLLFPSWIFYFVLGMVLTRERLEWLHRFSSQHTAVLLMVTALFSILYVMNSYVTDSLDSIKTDLNLFVPLVFTSCFGIWDAVKKVPGVRKLISVWSAHSMTIYFNHVLVLLCCRQFPFFSAGMRGMLLMYAAVLLVSSVIAVLLDRLFFCIAARGRAIRNHTA